MLKRFTKTVKLPIRKTPIRVAFSLAKYPNGNTAIRVHRPTLFGYDQCGDITMTTTAKFPEYCACVDTNHHGPELAEQLEKLKLVECMGFYEFHGAYKCPVFKLNLEKLKQYCIPTDAKNCV